MNFGFYPRRIACIRNENWPLFDAGNGEGKFKSEYKLQTTGELNNIFSPEYRVKSTSIYYENMHLYLDGKSTFSLKNCTPLNFILKYSSFLQVPLAAVSDTQHPFWNYVIYVPLMYINIQQYKIWNRFVSFSCTILAGITVLNAFYIEVYGAPTSVQLRRTSLTTFTQKFHYKSNVHKGSWYLKIRTRKKLTTKAEKI